MREVRVAKNMWVMVFGKKRRAYRQAPYAAKTLMLNSTGKCSETEERVEDVRHAFRGPCCGSSVNEKTARYTESERNSVVPWCNRMHERSRIASSVVSMMLTGLHVPCIWHS